MSSLCVRALDHRPSRRSLLRSTLAVRSLPARRDVPRAHTLRAIQQPARGTEQPTCGIPQGAYRVQSHDGSGIIRSMLVDWVERRLVNAIFKRESLVLTAVAFIGIDPTRPLMIFASRLSLDLSLARALFCSDLGATGRCLLLVGFRPRTLGTRSLF